MIHAFQYMGVPQYVLTDNMKSVVLRRDLDGHPVWQAEYEAFMRTVGFETKLCNKPSIEKQYGLLFQSGAIYISNNSTNLTDH